jgi:hypothetical protein
MTVSRVRTPLYPYRRAARGERGRKIEQEHANDYLDDVHDAQPEERLDRPPLKPRRLPAPSQSFPTDEELDSMWKKEPQ